MPDHPHSHPPHDESLGYLIARLKLRMSATLEEELVGLDITHAQWVVLVRIADGVANTGAELCKCLGYDTGSMTRMLDRLEEKQLIVRERSADDRRVVSLRLSDTGRALYPQWREASARVFERARVGMSDSEIETLRRLLRQMLANLTPPEDKS